MEAKGEVGRGGERKRDIGAARNGGLRQFSRAETEKSREDGEHLREEIKKKGVEYDFRLT